MNFRSLMTADQFRVVKALAKETQRQMDDLNAKVSSPGQRFYRLISSTLAKAHRLGYNGNARQWEVLVKRV